MRRKDYNILKELYAKSFYSELDKKVISELTKKYCVEFFPNGNNCNNCYKDAVIITTLKIKNAMSEKTKTNCKFEMKKNSHSINWGGIIISNETLTNQLAKKFIEAKGQAAYRFIVEKKKEAEEKK